MKVLIVAMGLAVSSLLFANEINLVKITSDADKVPSYMYIVLDKQGDISDFGKKDLNPHGKIISRVSFSTIEVLDGVVLKKQQGRNILIMRGHNMDSVYGGGLELDFLFNGITGSRKSFDLELVKQSHNWSLQVSGETIRHLHFKVHRKRFVGVVGIRRVDILK